MWVFDHEVRLQTLGCVMRNICSVPGDDRCLSLSRFLKTLYGLKPPCSGKR